MKYAPEQSQKYYLWEQKNEKCPQEGHYKTILNNVYYLNVHM